MHAPYIIHSSFLHSPSGCLPLAIGHPQHLLHIIQHQTSWLVLTPTSDRNVSQSYPLLNENDFRLEAEKVEVHQGSIHICTAGYVAYLHYCSLYWEQ